MPITSTLPQTNQPTVSTNQPINHAHLAATHVPRSIEANGALSPARLSLCVLPLAAVWGVARRGAQTMLPCAWLAGLCVRHFVCVFVWTGVVE